MREIAARKQASPAQIALAWLLAQAPWIVPIPGTTKTSRLEENVAGSELMLDADDVTQIGDALAQIEVHGARYPASMLANVGK